MRLKKIMEGSALRIILFILAAITIGTFITVSIADGVSDKQNLQKINIQRTALDEMLQSLEFKGLEVETKKKISDYAMQLDESMNIIITDDSGKVLFHRNDGYMPDADQFMVVVNPRDARPYQAFVIDSKNSIRYQMRLDRGYNSFKLVEKSANNDALRTLFPEEMDQVNPRSVPVEEGMRLKKMEIIEKSGMSSVIIAKDRFFENDLSNIMNYAYIGSRSWHVYSIFKNTGAYDYNTPNGLDRLVRFLTRVSLGSFLLFWFLLPLWVFHDARKREFKPALWGILVLATNIVGLIIYLLVRTELVVCKQCGAQLHPKFVSCPNCGAQNRERCAACKQIIEKSWIACPYCGQLKTGMDVNSNSANL